MLPAPSRARTLTLGDPAQVEFSPARLLRLQDACAGWVRQGAIPVLSVLVARRGRIVLQQAWGQLGPEPNAPQAGPDVIFPAASLSKPVTAAAVMTLVEQGLLGLNRPLQSCLPEFRGPGCEKITVRHLLSHTSGLPYQTPGEVLQAGQAGLEAEPGTRMAYSNAGYDLLGALVERLSGLPFAEFTRQHIFQPLGMPDTSFIHYGQPPERSVRKHPGTPFTWPAAAEGQASPSGSLWTTTLDLGVFLQTFLNGGAYGETRLLSPATVAAMTRSQTVQVSVEGLPRDPSLGSTNAPHGFGWFMLGEVRFPNTPGLWSPLAYGHAGASGAFAWIDPPHDLLGVFFGARLRPDLHPLDLFIDGLMGCLT